MYRKRIAYGQSAFFLQIVQKRIFREDTYARKSKLKHILFAFLLTKSYLCSQQYYFPEKLNYMRMKKFTLMIIAALMAVTANAQKLERAQLARPMQNRVSMTASPMQSKVNSVTRPMQGKTQSVETIKQIKKARKAAAVSSIDDLTGTWMQIYYSGFDEAILSTIIEITKTEGSENSITITGWWGSWTEPIEAKVDIAAGTVTIDPQLLYEYEGDSPAELINVTTEGAALIGTIEEDGSISFEDEWAAHIIGGEQSYEYAQFTMLVRPNGKMNYVNGEETYSNDVYIEQDEEFVYIYNFADLGRMIDLELIPDKTVSVPEGQVMYSYSGDSYILYGVEGGYVGSLTATWTETEIAFDMPWTGFVDDENSENYGDNFGLNSLCTITLTDGSVFDDGQPEEVAATPATPTDLTYEMTQWGPRIQFNVPLQDVDGNKLRQDRLYYQIYYMKDGTVYAYRLKAGEDAYTKLESDLEEILYYFTDYWDIFSYGVDQGKRVYLYGTDGWEKVGVKSIYQGGGETHVSGIIWYNIADGTVTVEEDTTGISQVNAAQQNGGKAFNLAGQQVKQGYKGIVIKDGKKFMVK